MLFAHGRTTRTLLLPTALLLGLAVGLTGCGESWGPTDPDHDSDPDPDSAEPAAELTVYAAASLQSAFDELTQQFDEEHPEINVAPPIYDGSSTLATQLISGAAGDVFASADQPTMQDVMDEDLTNGDPVDVAVNELVIAVAPGNPLGIESLADLSEPTESGELPLTVRCADEVPCGRAALGLMEEAGVTPNVVSQEQNVTATLAKVLNGEADAGLVYRTDVMASEGEAEAVSIDGASEDPNRYPIAVMNESQSPEAAQEFVEFVVSDEGQQVLESYGFGAP